MGVREDKTLQIEERDLEIPTTIRDEVEAAQWAMKRGASPGVLGEYLDSWKEKVRPKVEKKKVVTVTNTKEETPTSTKVENKVKEAVKPVKRSTLTSK